MRKYLNLSFLFEMSVFVECIPEICYSTAWQAWPSRSGEKHISKFQPYFEIFVFVICTNFYRTFMEYVIQRNIFNTCDFFRLEKWVVLKKISLVK